MSNDFWTEAAQPGILVGHGAAWTWGHCRTLRWLSSLGELHVPGLVDLLRENAAPTNGAVPALRGDGSPFPVHAEDLARHIGCLSSCLPVSAGLSPLQVGLPLGRPWQAPPSCVMRSMSQEKHGRLDGSAEAGSGAHGVQETAAEAWAVHRGHTMAMRQHLPRPGPPRAGG